MRVYRFGEFEADEAKFELRHRGEIVRVQRLVLETIFFFLQSNGQVLTKRELAQGPWRGFNVSHGAVSRAIMLARRAISDHSASMIVTVRGRGYRFTPDIETAPISGSKPLLKAGHALETASPTIGQSSHIDDTPSSPLGAHTAELQTLHAEFRRAKAGRGRIVVLSGAARIGKTTLIEHFAQHIERRGSLVAWGRCWQATCAPELWPWLEIARYCLYAVESDNVRCSPDLASSLVSLVSHLTQRQFAAREVAQADSYLPVFDQMARLLSELARSNPVVLVFEDLHNADRASLLLLEFLRQRIRCTSLLVVATRRTAGTSGEDGSPFDEAGGHVRTLALSGSFRSDFVRELNASFGG